MNPPRCRTLHIDCRAILSPACNTRKNRPEDLPGGSREKREGSWLAVPRDRAQLAGQEMVRRPGAADQQFAILELLEIGRASCRERV